MLPSVQETSGSSLAPSHPVLSSFPIRIGQFNRLYYSESIYVGALNLSLHSSRQMNENEKHIHLKIEQKTTKDKNVYNNDGNNQQSKPSKTSKKRIPGIVA